MFNLHLLEFLLQNISLSTVVHISAEYDRTRHVADCCCRRAKQYDVPE